LVVDDSTSVRHMLVALLRKHRYQVLEAARGQTALDLAEKHKDIKLAIIDFHMPEMDGFLLTKKLRLQFRKERMAIIGLSSYGNNILSAKFIKYGANDFISKPFLEEEFYCRVSQNIDFIDHFSAMEKSQKNMVELNNLLLEAAKLRDDMDSIMRHDLKNPLGIVISGPEIIQEVGECNAAQKEILRGIETSGFRLLEMINRSLDLYKIENGKYDLHQAEVDLGSVVEKAMSELAILCRSKEISLKKIEGKQRELSILGEDMLCHSIFSNLIKNAIEASPFRENIEISIRVHGNMALTQIHNRGQVPQEIRNSFFDKFVSYQKTAGTGIGTYSSRLFARLQGGDIHLDTETDPQGTIVIVSLPLVKKNFGGTASKPSLGEDNPPRPPATTL
ncbi:MAG TPA: response regulator, partial [Magnetococcales bacterium]|nr:response regulator [Magnetococcales bacterium]